MKAHRMHQRFAKLDDVETVAYREVGDQPQGKHGDSPSAIFQKLLWTIFSELNWLLRKHVASRPFNKG